jgi:hypothetical protein
MSRLANVLDQDMDFNPTITPVLDLTKVQQEASKLGGILSTNALATDLSFTQAALLSASSRQAEDISAVTSPPATREVKFEQNITSTTPLSLSDIYRQTKNQIAMAKEELAVL